jgi:hypothetical protein
MHEACPPARKTRHRAMLPLTLFSPRIMRARAATRAQDLRTLGCDDPVCNIEAPLP